MTYYSKVDWYIGLPIALGSVALVGGATAAMVALHDFRVLGPVGLVVVLTFLVMWPLYYELTDAELFVRSGLMRWHIPFGSILRVRPSSSLLSSPALSLDRLEIAWEKHGRVRKILISPKDSEGFLQELRGHVPQLEPGYGGLVRRGAYVPM